MGPADIRLAPERPEAADAAKQPQLKPLTRPEIISITSTQLSKIAEKLPVSMMNGTRVFGDATRFADSGDIPLCVCCHCECWDLTKPEDRDAYSELYSKLAAGATNIEVEWQERVNDQGKLIIYITYIESLRIVDAENVLKEICGA